MNTIVIVVLALMPFVFAAAAMIFGNRRPRRRSDSDLLTVR
ncbi:hypothetical protein [Pseudonocardia sp. TRM90224]|nr:hypothetical protein [Pseudonocardia sp. TRM90224]